MVVNPGGCHDSSRRIWSLWEMMTKFAFRHIHVIEMVSLRAMLCIARRADAEIDPGELNSIAEELGRLKTDVAVVGLTDSARKIERTINWFSGGILNSQAIGSELRNVIEAIEVEAEKRVYFSIDGDRAKYLSEIVFGLSVYTVFPQARYDIENAGKCLALECHTAAVFHLMRTAEWGMRSLCSEFGLLRIRKSRKSGKVTYQPLEYSEWEKILDQLQEKVDIKLSRLKRGQSKQELQELYYPLLQDLKGFRDAWRNHVMHTRAEYTSEDALAVFSHVKRFMEALCSRVQ